MLSEDWVPRGIMNQLLSLCYQVHKKALFSSQKNTHYSFTSSCQMTYASHISHNNVILNCLSSFSEFEHNIIKWSNLILVTHLLLCTSSKHNYIEAVVLWQGTPDIHCIMDDSTLQREARVLLIWMLPCCTDNVMWKQSQLQARCSCVFVYILKCNNGFKL